MFMKRSANMKPTLKLLFTFSVILFILTGHFLALSVSTNKETAWIYVLVFYAGWIIFSLTVLLRSTDLQQMFKLSSNALWNLLPLIFIIPTVIFLFIPNLHLIKTDNWLLANFIICICGPFLEEVYWRGLFQKIYGTSIYSFLLSSFLFGLSHPLIFGINSKGDSGVPAFVGTFIVGATWWFCYYKTRSLRGAVLTHFLMDVAGMAVYVLTNKVKLLPIN